MRVMVSSSDWITISGAIITLISMAVSIRQAKSARKSSRDAMSAMAAVQLSAVGERLKSTQEHIRDVGPPKKQERGYKVGNRFDLIRREFDNALSALPKTGHGSTARRLLTQAQIKLNDYQESFHLEPDSETWRELQVLVQDTISELASNSTSIGD
ncbi:putative membrane protein [Brucella inopinata]|nr:putative membrane protein [Brucella inopinata]